MSKLCEHFRCDKLKQNRIYYNTVLFYFPALFRFLPHFPHYEHRLDTCSAGKLMDNNLKFFFLTSPEQSFFPTKYMFTVVPIMKETDNNKELKRDLRPKTHHCFHGIILMIIWKKNFVQSFVVLWPALKKLWSCKVLNPAWVTSYPRMY